MIEKKSTTLGDISKKKKNTSHAKKDAENTPTILADVLQRNCEDQARVAVKGENIL